MKGIVAAYNKTIHATLGRTPNSVTEANQFEFYKQFYHPQYKAVANGKGKPRLKEGDRVVIVIPRSLSQRSYDRQYTLEQFVVTRIVTTNPIRYELKNAKGDVLLRKYYEGELKKIEFGVRHSDFHDVEVLDRRTAADGSGKEEVLVHYLSEPRDMTHWIPASNLKDL